VRKVVEKVGRVQQDQKSIGPGYTVYEDSRWSSIEYGRAI
jgi:hypothetical protein